MHTITLVPPRKRAPAAPPPLTDADVATLRSRVQAGERPRVIVRAASASVPAGTRGGVVRIGNPSDGEFIIVRLGKDEVPFAPGELATTSRSTSAPTRTPAKRAATPTKKVAAAKQLPAAATKAPAARKPAVAKSPAPAQKVKQARTSTKKAAPRRALPSLVVTLRFTDGRWTVEAAKGTRRLAKPSPVRPGAVKAFADLLDETPVRDALAERVESGRSVVEARAAALRAELDAAESALKEYEARRR